MIRIVAAIWSVLLLAAALPASVTAAELVMVESRTCIWCIRWHQEVGISYEKTEEGRIAPLRRHWLESGQPSAIELSAPVRMTPTFLLVEEGREIGRIIGYPGEDAFWGLLGQELSKLGQPSPPSGVQPEPLTRTSW